MFFGCIYSESQCVVIGVDRLYNFDDDKNIEVVVSGSSVE